MKWITREGPTIDRLACPWLIKRFIDHGAVILYVPFEKVMTATKKLKAVPFDVSDDKEHLRVLRVRGVIALGKCSTKQYCLRKSLKG